MDTKGLQTKSPDADSPSSHRTALRAEPSDAAADLDSVRRLLRKGEIHEARQRAAKLASTHPDHPDVLQMHELLNLGRSHTSPASGRSTRRELEFLRDPPHEYRGKWVAVIDGEIVCEADSLKELVDRLPPDLDQPPLAMQIAA